MNFTPAYVHQLHNKTLVFQELKTLKQAARDRRKAYWLNPETLRQDPVEGDTPTMDPVEIVPYRANTEGVLEGEGAITLHAHHEGEHSPKRDSLTFPILSH